MYEPRPTPFASLHFPGSTYALPPDSVANFGFLFTPDGGGAGFGLDSDSTAALASETPNTKIGFAAIRTPAVFLQSHSSEPVSVGSSASSSPSSPNSSPSSSIAAIAAGTVVTYPQRPRARDHLSSAQSPPFAAEMDSQQHDVAAQQEAAEKYQPDLEGPLVGEKTTSHAITAEYAKADPIYVEKTMALPHTYSHYRPIQGDGNCGWRAIGYSYFEKLIEVGDQAQIEGEVSRLKSFGQMLNSVGGYEYVEDFAEEVLDLLRDLASNVVNPAMAHAILFQRWNDSVISQSIIFYFRLLAATFLKANTETYSPFVSEEYTDIAAYCNTSIEIPNREIEHLGIVALSNLLLKPVNFVLEIAYLDRSQGTEVNRYRFPEEANDQDPATLGPVIYLLYRPDHYDILYQSFEPAPSVPMPPLAINRVSGFSHNIRIANTQSSLGNYSSVDYSPLALIPGMGPIGTGMSPSLPTPTAPGHMGEPFAAQQQSQWMLPYADDMPSPTAPPSSRQQLPALAVPAPPPSSASTSTLTPTTPIGSGSSMLGNTGIGGAQGGMLQGMQGQGPTSLASAPGYPIRFSPVQLEYDEGNSGLPEQTFHVTTTTFKNSVWNRAHYGNPDFHPEEWIPDDDGIDGRISGRRRSRKDS